MKKNSLLLPGLALSMLCMGALTAGCAGPVGGASGAGDDLPSPHLASSVATTPPVVGGSYCNSDAGVPNPNCADDVEPGASVELGPQVTLILGEASPVTASESCACVAGATIQRVPVRVINRAKVPFDLPSVIYEASSDGELLRQINDPQNRVDALFRLKHPSLDPNTDALLPGQTFDGFIAFDSTQSDIKVGVKSNWVTPAAEYDVGSES